MLLTLVLNISWSFASYPLHCTMHDIEAHTWICHQETGYQQNLKEKYKLISNLISPNKCQTTRIVEECHLLGCGAV
jgi:hypothetical protein